MDGGRLERIVRYPVKGLRGVEAPSARLEPGRGLRYDRSLAIERGVIPVASPTGWNPRETYFHVAKDEEIVRLRTDIRDAESETENAVLTISAGRRGSVDVRLSAHGFDHDRDGANALLRRVLPPGPLGGPTLSRTGAGLWDWPRAHLSIINLATLRALGDAARAPVHWRRFRGNLYLDGLPPWGELTYLGGRIRIGGAVLEVFQPTDRCRATTIDPESAESNLNVPALLASRFGHMFCGLYARVIEAGTLAAGDAIEVEQPDSVPLPAAEPEWPRAARVVERRQESSAVVSFWLGDATGTAQKAVPGQHIRIGLPGAEAPSWRCYTVSAVRDDAVRISVKRDGRISQALHDGMGRGDWLVLTGPFGDVTLDAGAAGDIVLLSAGVGITPTVAMLRALATAGHAGRVRVLHVDRTAADVPLWDDVLEAAGRVSDLRVELFLTREDAANAARSGARPGRPDRAAFEALLDGLDRGALSAYACGPGSFSADARTTLTGLGVPDESIGTEVFFSPTTAELAEPRSPSTPGPHSITVGTDAIEWTPARGSILDAVEGTGTPWPSGCRVGACGTCAQRLVSGEIEYLSDPLSPPRAGRVLVCCSVPVTDVCFAGEG